MPPRKRQAKSSSTSKPAKTPTPRRSALAKEHGISAAQEAEIRSAFDLFSGEPPSDDEADYGPDGALPNSALRKALTALGAAPSSKSELQVLLDTVDPDETGWIGLEGFVAVAAIKIEAKSEEESREEVEEAFRLFVGGHAGGGAGGEIQNVQDPKITVGSLKRVARALKEDVDEQVLRDMIAEANGGRGVARGVGIDEFEAVMRRAGAIR